MIEKHKTKNISKKGARGITLIALVVTIIVLLILAGISIIMLTGNNGILTRAAEAKIETIAGQVQEERDLWNLSKTTDTYLTTKVAESLEELLERLGPENQKLLTSEQVEEIKTTGQVKIGSRTIVFGIEIGDVVEVTGLATFKDSGNNNIEWIYFGKDSNGNNLVTPAKPLTNTFELHKQHSEASSDDEIVNSAKKWLYYDLQENDDNYSDEECTTENNINKFCADLYTRNGGVVGKARSITLEDINRVTGYTEPTFIPITFGTGTGEYNYYPTIEAKNQDTNTSAYPPVYKYWKKATEASEKTFIATEIHPLYYYDSSICTSENMKYVVGEDTNNYYFYTVGSRSVRTHSGIASFEVAGVYNGYVNSDFDGLCYTLSGFPYTYGGDAVPVRPIVSLESEIQLNKVQ